MNDRNQQYSITAITDGSGAVVERYAYTAYGTPTITDPSGTTRSTTAVGNRYMYTGREWDETLAQYHYRARMYDSVGGRFVSRDPIGFEGTRWGLYEYVSGRPLGAVDPLGLETAVAAPESPVGPHHQIPRGPTYPTRIPTTPARPVPIPPGPKPLQLVVITVCAYASYEVGQRCTKPVCVKVLYWIFDSDQPPAPPIYPPHCWDEYEKGAQQCEDDYPPEVAPDGTSYQNCLDAKEQILRKCTKDAGWPDPG